MTENDDELADAIRSLQSHAACGDQVRDKGCWTARGDGQDGGREGAVLTYDDELALRERRCICTSSRWARVLLAHIKGMQ